MNKLNRQTISDGVYFNSVHDGRFKTMRISATIFVPLQNETAAENALVSQLLTRCCEEYPDFTLLSKRLSGLYGASLSGGVRKMGDTQVITVSIAGLDDRYALDNESISQQLSELLCSVIFSPRLNGQAFDSGDLTQERRQLLDLIDSEFNDKRIYAATKALEVMCRDEIFGIKRYGMAEQINAATESSLYQAWQNILKTATFNFMYVGDSSADKIYTVFKNRFAGIERNPAPLSTEVVKTVKAVKEETEKMELSQCKLIMGFRTVIAEPDARVNAMRLASAILGGGATSKLFNNVREKLSLCYYCAARYDRTKGILLIESGVESANIQKAKEAILQEIEAMKQGEITDFEIESAKLSVCNSFNSSNDTVGGLENWYISQLLDQEIITSEEMCEKINAVTKEEIIDVWQNIQLDTVYTLESNG